MIRLLDLYQDAGIRPGALEFLYELMKEREPEINISYQALPTFEQHRQFVTRRPYRLWYLIDTCTGAVVDTDPPHQHPVLAGYISATHQNEIGIVLLKAYRGQGLGPLAIQELMRLHSPLPADPSVRNGRWLANIAPTNEHSKHVFQTLGFRKIQETYEFHEEEGHHGEETGKA